MRKKIVSTTEAPAPGGHYSQAVVANGLVFVAGQLPIRVASSGGAPEVPDGIEAQTRQALANAETILGAAGCALNDVVNATIFITDIALWPDVNRVFAEVFGTYKPARTMAVSPQLHFGCLVEVQIVASLPG